MPTSSVAPETALVILAVASLAACIILLGRLVARHPKDAALLRSDRKAFSFGELCVIPFIIAAVIAPTPYQAIGAAVAIPAVLGMGWAQNRRLARAGATPAFMRQLLVANALAGIGLVAFMGTSFLAVRS